MQSAVPDSASSFTMMPRRPPRREARADSSSSLGTPPPATASFAHASRAQVQDAEDGNEDGEAPHSLADLLDQESQGSSPLTVPSDDDDDYDPRQLEDDDDEYVGDTVPAKRQRSSTTAATSTGLSQHGVSRIAAATSSDFPFVAASRGKAAEWGDAEDQLLLECIRKHRRRWGAVAKMYAQMAKGRPPRSAEALKRRYGRLSAEAMKHQSLQQRKGKSSSSRFASKPTTHSQRASASSRASEASSSISAASKGPPRQQSSSSRREGRDDFFLATDASHNAQSLSAKQEVPENASPPWPADSRSPAHEPSSAAAVSQRSNMDRPRSQVEYSVTHQKYGLVFQGVPPGYQIEIFSPDRYTVRVPSSSGRSTTGGVCDHQQQPGRDEEKAAFAFKVLEGSIEATTLPPYTRTQISLAPPSMTYLAKDKFKVVFLL